MALAFCLAPSAHADSSSSPPGSQQARLVPWAGDRKPVFSLDDLRGEQRALQTYAGNVILVHFFATWCEPCVREMASLQKLTEIATDKPLTIIAVDVAEVDLRVRAFFEKRPVAFPVLLDRDRAVTKAWDVSGLPTTFVLAPDLSPRLFIEGDLDWARADVVAAIEALYPTRRDDAIEPQTTASTTTRSPEEATR